MVKRVLFGKVSYFVQPEMLEILETLKFSILKSKLFDLSYWKAF